LNVRGAGGGSHGGSVKRSRWVAVSDQVERLGGPEAFERACEDAFGPGETEALARRGSSVEGRVARLLAKQLLGELLDLHVPPREIQVVTDADGRPRVSGPAVRRDIAQRLHVSLSHDGGLAAALVVLDLAGPES
jgi:hypothetical protein